MIYFDLFHAKCFMLYTSVDVSEDVCAHGQPPHAVWGGSATYLSTDVPDNQRHDMACHGAKAPLLNSMHQFSTMACNKNM